MPEPVPPWVACPDQDPDRSMTQGPIEAVMVEWVPFWRGLGLDEKARYLDRWAAPVEWRETIAFDFDLTDEELAQDARESEEWLARRQAERPPRRSWLRRLFGG